MFRPANRPQDEFSLRQTLDLDNLQAHADAAFLAEKFDVIVSKDIRLATLRAYCAMDAVFVFQCLSAMRNYWMISVQCGHFIRI